MKKSKRLTINAGLNVIKQLFTILFPLITFPYASRVLGVENYGKINFGSSIISYFSLLAGLGIYNYGIREGARVKDNTAQLYNLSNEIFSINLISTIVSYGLLILLLIFNVKLKGYTALLLIQSSVIIFTTIGIDWFNVIFEDYLFITVRYIICQIISVVCMLLFVKEEGDYLQYALASVLSGVIANISNVLYIKKKYNYFPKYVFKINYRKHLVPIMIMFSSAIATLIYINSDVTILGILKDDVVVGLYSVSAKIYTLVKQLLNALLVVAIPRISNEIARKEFEVVDKHYNKIFSYLILVLGPASMGLFVLSENIIELFCGREYLQASNSLKILAIALFFATVACFFVNVVMIPNRMEKYVLRSTVLSATANIVLNLLLIPKFGQNAAALTTAIAELVMLICGIHYTRNVLNIHFGKSILISIISSILIFVICLISREIFNNNILTVVISIACSGVAWIMCIVGGKYFMVR